jgi:hypothetical protein
MRRKKHRPQRKNLAKLEGLDDHPVRPGRLIVAAHYDGDTSNYKLGHTHYQGRCRGPGIRAQILQSIINIIVVVVVIIIIIHSFINSFMQGIYTYIPETNHVPREHSAVTVL